MKKYVCLLCGEILKEDELFKHLEARHYDEIIFENFDEVDSDA